MPFSVPAPWPVRPCCHPVLPAAAQRRLRRIANALREDEPELAASDRFGPLVSPGWRPAPSVFLEEHGGIQLATAADSRRLQYRCLALAGDGDLVLFDGPRCPVFETYLARTVGLGWPEIIQLGGRGPRRADQQGLLAGCLGDPGTIARLASAARRAGTLNLVPYLTSTDLWRLAARIAEQARVPVQVAAAMPLLGQRINDKLWFTRLADRCLGPRAVPATLEAHGPSVAAHRIRTLARAAGTVVVKLPGSAGSRGNVVLDAAPLRGLDLAAIRARLLALTRAEGFGDSYPLLVGVWTPQVLHSPSVQTWIPDPADGPPVIEAVFEQLLHGDAGAFVGAEPARLAPELLGRLAGEALQLATLLQELGGFGRCSFDAVLWGQGAQATGIQWIECNGRWGGASIPMTLGRRLMPRRGPGGLCIVQLTQPERALAPFERVIEAMGPRLFRPGARRGVVFLLPTGAPARALSYLALGESEADARALARETRQIVTGIPGALQA